MLNCHFLFCPLERKSNLMKSKERPLHFVILQPLKGKDLEFVQSTGWLQVMWPIFSVMLEKLYLLKG